MVAFQPCATPRSRPFAQTLPRDFFAIFGGERKGLGTRLIKSLNSLGPILKVGFDDLAAHWAVPAVIAQCVEKGLVDDPPYKFVRNRIGKHVLQRVRLRFDLEFIASMNVLCELVEGRFTCVDNHRVVFRGCNRTHSVAKFSGEKIIP